MGLRCSRLFSALLPHLQASEVSACLPTDTTGSILSSFCPCPAVAYWYSWHEMLNYWWGLSGPPSPVPENQGRQVLWVGLSQSFLPNGRREFPVGPPDAVNFGFHCSPRSSGSQPPGSQEQDGFLPSPSSCRLLFPRRPGSGSAQEFMPLQLGGHSHATPSFWGTGRKELVSDSPCSSAWGTQGF